MSGSSLRDWLLTSGSNGITNEALVDELVGAFKKQGEFPRRHLHNKVLAPFAAGCGP